MTLNLDKMVHEFDRMDRGEIPFDPDYLSELIEHDGDATPSLVCADCKDMMLFVICPDCESFGCSSCDNLGGLFYCERCSGKVSI